MGFKCGIVGLPNVGKSTLFNALTQSQVDAANYPFCTIDPHVGVVPVPDPRLAALAEIVHPQKTLPTTLTFVDIAGLVKGASKGEGLGNQFLANIRETEAIAHVVRCFENPNVVHVEGKLDPISDIATIEMELILADLATLEKAKEKAVKKSKAGDKEALALKVLTEQLITHLDEGHPLHTFDLDVEDNLTLKSFGLLTLKPVMIIANVDENGFQENPFLDSVRDYANARHMPVIPICAALEADMLALAPEEREEWMVAAGIKEPGLNSVIRAGYDLLNLQTYFTAGPKEVRAWTIPKGATAPQAAGVIHTDFEKGFIRAEVISFDDFIQYKGEQGAKEAGKLRQEGKQYIPKEGDVMHFLFNV